MYVKWFCWCVGFVSVRAILTIHVNAWQAQFSSLSFGEDSDHGKPRHLLRQSEKQHLLQAASGEYWVSTRGTVRHIRNHHGP